MISKGFQPQDENGTIVTIRMYVTRSFGKMFSTTYLPTFCLLILVQMTFYFPEENFQVRATVSLSCLLILSTLFGSTSRSLPTTTQITFVEIWMIFAVLMTFSQVILHTIIGYIKEKEKKSKIGNSFIQVRNITQEKKSNPEKPIFPLSNKINLYFGRIIFPTIFLMCSLTYTLMVIVSSNNNEHHNFPVFQCE